MFEGRLSALLTHILGVGGPENFAILPLDGKENVILWVGGIVRLPHMIVYGANSGGGWSEKFCNCGGRWSEKFVILGVGGPKSRHPPH